MRLEHHISRVIAIPSGLQKVHILNLGAVFCLYLAHRPSRATALIPARLAHSSNVTSSFQLYIDIMELIFFFKLSLHLLRSNLQEGVLNASTNPSHTPNYLEAQTNLLARYINLLPPPHNIWYTRTRYSATVHTKSDPTIHWYFLKVKS